MNPGNWPNRLALLAIVVFAFALTFYSGMRGLFPLDQSIVFDGGYRIYCGQVPFRDFYAPYGPVAFYWQAAMFHICGVNFYAYAMGAAVLNVIGVLCAYAITQRLFSGKSRAGLIASLVTATWLYAPFATTYPEQTTFCTILFGLLLVLLAAQRGDGWRKGGLEAGFLLLAGSVAAIGVLTKHNAGLIALPLYTIAIVVTRWPTWRRCVAGLACFSAGVAIAAAAFIAWLHTSSDASAFAYHVITIPSKIGAERMFSDGWTRFVRALLTGKGNDLLRVLIVHWGLVFLMVAALCLRHRAAFNAERRQIVVAALLGLAMIGYQNAFSMVSQNSGANEKPFLGLFLAITLVMLQFLYRNFVRQQVPVAVLLPRWLILVVPAVAVGLSLLLGNGALAGGAILTAVLAHGLGCVRAPAPNSIASRLSWRMPMPLLTSSVVGVAVFLACYGTAISVSRRVHDCFVADDKRPMLFAAIDPYRFEDRITAPGLRGLRWGAPTLVRDSQITAAELEGVIAHLKQQGRPFFVFPDCTFLYAALGVPSPQPLLWFHRGLTYPYQYEPVLDEKVVEGLRRSGVQTIVLEKDSFFGTQKTLADFPMLKAYLEQEFEPDRQFGFFQVYRQRESFARKPDVKNRL